jgi:hypothetical protein
MYNVFTCVNIASNISRTNVSIGSVGLSVGTISLTWRRPQQLKGRQGLNRSLDVPTATEPESRRPLAVALGFG